MSEYLSQYLLRSEYECGHCQGLPPDLFIHDIKRPYSTLFDIFDSVRATWGRPIHVSSGYRCPYHNSQIGGSACSPHMFGLALDLDLPNTAEVEELYSILDTDFNHLRIGKYVQTGSFIHMDIAFEVSPRPSHNFVRGARWFK